MKEIEAAEEPTIVDALNADVNPKELPKDAPPLWPYLRLPFRKRAKFFSIYRKLQAQQAELEAVEKRRTRKNAAKKDDALFDQAEALYELYATMDDLMELASVDHEAYRAWVESHSDEEFAELFSAYVERSQPGEASSSAS